MPIQIRPARDEARGQSIVEFALTLPLLLLLMLGILDLARIYTTMLSVESAAREAADFGTFGSQKWNVAVYNGTEAKMERRACVAASDLPDYVGPDDACTNPSFSYELSTDRGATWVGYDEALGCDDPVREPPCWVRVTLAYDFRLLIPFNLEIFGATYGMPESLTFERSSIFAMTDLEIP
jgi:TadE-like protein